MSSSGKILCNKTITTGTPTKLLFGFNFILKTRRKWIFRCFTKTNEIKVEIGDFSATSGNKEVVSYHSSQLGRFRTYVKPRLY